MTRIAIIFSLLFVTPAWAEWRYITSTQAGDDYYLDFDQIRWANGYVYYWLLDNYTEPLDKFMSAKSYQKGDCDSLGYQSLQTTLYYQPMGVEKWKTWSPDPEWQYPRPGGAAETIMKLVCREAGLKK